MATFEIIGIPGSFDGETWAIDDDDFRAALPVLADLYRQSSPGYHPNETNAIVEFVMSTVGGRVVKLDPVESDPDRIY